MFKILTAVLALLLVQIILPWSAQAGDLALIDAAQLKGSAASYVVLDARPRAEWLAGHIPGAISFSWDEYTRTDARGVKYSSFPPGELAALLGAMGISERTPLVIYGDADKSWGGEGYDAWLFSWLGHKGAVRLLNGGIQSWRGAGLPLIAGAEARQVKKVPYLFQAKPRTVVSTEELQGQKDACTVIDVRSTFEWLKGRIPGAVHIPWDDFYTGKERRPLNGAELRKLLTKHGVDLKKPVVYYCLGGVRSGYAWTVHQLAGLPEARNYKGGWEAWDKRDVR
ncbi:sulfurtransferase [Geomonas anaerohicana]|uniref:Sulfurtransferase n=1 Tax=Geomonas anaerohicana TaxID=2798583 RepID=A0ABS0YAS4_9BACT|nr:rhodanese-like domain-containing protein [Geomonas anaerohicana]MBJ6749410.1 sulfurtransferase [Geomonas anaerohicana]